MTKVKNLLDKLSPEDRRKLKEYSSGFKIDTDNEWIMLTEFIQLTGLAGYHAVRDDEISYEEMEAIVNANRALQISEQVRAAESTFIAILSTKTKTPSKTFDRLIKQLTKPIRNEDE